MTKISVQHRDAAFPLAPIPGLLNAAWAPAAALGLLAASGGALACGYNYTPSITATSVAPGGSVTAKSIMMYAGGCGNRARVRWVSGSCNNTTTAWIGQATACSCGGTASQAYTMSASPTAPCVVIAEGTDTCGDHPQTTYTIMATQAITFNAQSPASQTYTTGGTFAINPTATASSGLAVAYGSSTAGVCTVAGTTVTMVGAGTCTITADQGGNAVFNPAAQVTQNVAISKANQTITFNAQSPASQAFATGGTFAINPTATASSGLAVAYGSSTPGVCTVAGTTVTMVSIGTCTITANQGGNSGYNAAAQVTQSVSITKGTQVITFGAQAAQTYSSGGTFAVSPLATTTSSSPVVYSSLTAGVCTIAGSTVTIVTAGTCTIAANAAADANYNVAAQVTQNITVNKATQTITFGANPGPKTYGNAPFAVSATTPSTSPVTFSSTTTGVCTIAGSTVTIVTAGTCIIAANAVADTNYNAAAQATQSITINKATQTITFGAQAAQTYSSGGTFALSPVATASTGLAVSYSSTTPGVCTIAGTTVTMVTGGTCTIAANQAGNANYSAAPQVTQSIAIGVASQTITVTTAAPASAAGGSTFPVAATASSGLPVAVTTGGSCSGSGTSTGGSSVTITMISPIGTCTVYYDQAGSVSYAAANQVTNTTAAAGLTQAISVTTAAPATAAYASTFPVAATATSGLAVAITTGGGCTGSGSASTTITMTSASISCTVYYNQPGNAVYYAAAQVTSTTSATKADQAITVTSAPPPYASNGASFNVAATASSGLAVAITTTGSCTGSGSASATITMNATSGDCLVHFNQGGNAGYNAAPEVIMGAAAGSGVGTCQSGEGTYTALQFSNTGGYLGWACNGGSIDCTPTWNLEPGIGFKGHVLQTKNDPGKTFKFQLAPDGSGYYNIINTTDNTCWALGNAIYECSGTRTGSNCNAGYLTAIKDSATLPAAPCNYNASTAKWIINNSGSYMTIQAKGDGGFYGDNGSGGFCGGTDIFGLSRITGLMDFGYSDWGDSWVRNALPSCGSTGARITCSGFLPLVPDHIRFEFDSNALTCQSSAVTIKACTNVAGSVGSASTCSPYAGYINLTPGATKGTWGGLTSAPTTGFTGTSSGITLTDLATATESTTLSYSSPSVALTTAAPECYDTSTSKVVSCSALTFTKCEFNAIDSYQTPATTHIYTKLAGTAFNYIVTGPAPYTGNIRVDLVDGGSGWACASGDPTTLSSSTAAFASGGVTFGATSNDAVPAVRVRIRDDLGNCYNSSDFFSIRPANFNLSTTSPIAVAAGDDFVISAEAVNSSGGRTTSYAGVPTLDQAQITDWQETAIPGSLTGSFDALSGGISPGGKSIFQYANIGPLTFPALTDTTSPVDDKTFTNASGDQAGSDCIPNNYSNTLTSGKYGCYIGSTAWTSPRFYPHHYSVTNTLTAACLAGGFTYMGQNLGGLELTVTALSKGDTTLTRLDKEYANHKPTFIVDAQNTVGGVTTPFSPATTKVSLTTPFDWTGGTYANVATATIRPAASADYESFTLITTITDFDNSPIQTCSGAGTATTCTSVPTILRFGRLKLENNYGSELLPLGLLVTAQFWDGPSSSWRTNLLDSCTSIALANIAVGNYAPAANLSSLTLTVASPTALLPVTLNQGQGAILFNKPTNAKTGSADVAINLGPAAALNSCVTWNSGPNATAGASMSYLQGNWCGTTYVKDPSARITFGSARSPFLYMREKY